MTLVRQDNRRASLFVRDDLKDADEDIAEYGDGSVIRCKDGYNIYDESKTRSGGRPSGCHPLDTYVIDDAHVNTCENRHGFFRQWLVKVRGVSKHHLQGYLDFLALKLNSP